MFDFRASAEEAERTVFDGFRSYQNGPSILLTIDRFSEGVSVTDIDMLVMLRATLSPRITVQQIGRGVRRHVGKEHCVVVDAVRCQERWSKWEDTGTVDVVVASEPVPPDAPVEPDVPLPPEPRLTRDNDPLGEVIGEILATPFAPRQEKPRINSSFIWAITGSARLRKAISVMLGRGGVRFTEHMILRYRLDEEEALKQAFVAAGLEGNLQRAYVKLKAASLD